MKSWNKTSKLLYGQILGKQLSLASGCALPKLKTYPRPMSGRQSINWYVNPRAIYNHLNFILFNYLSAQNLRSHSDELMLPIPQLTFRCTGEIATAALPAGNLTTNPLPLKGLVNCPPETKDRPAQMKVRDHNLPVRPLPARSRQKTRWDPTTGKRIPIAFPIPSAVVSNQSLGIAEPAEQDDYEQRLSYRLSNASLG